MAKIKVLPEVVINKIAAGEVIERPASVIKELAENSIDAGSTRIDIEVRGGGQEYIRITDNGSGIPAEEVPIALERHATSKIDDAADLFSIHTLGFRGEAIPSIASVSRFTLQTKTATEDTGTIVRITGGSIVEKAEIGIPQGTTIMVENLFFNTPARLKYLKMPQTELSQITDVVSKLAIIYPEISFRLVSQGRTLLQTPGNNKLIEVLANIYGKDFARALIPINFASSLLKITGYIGKPELTRNNRNYQVLMLNRRLIRSRTVSSALDRAYAGLLLTQRYPVAFISLEIDPEQVDVNVHPTKMEVRIAQESEVFRQVMIAAKKTLEVDILIPGERQETLGQEVMVQPEKASEKTEQIAFDLFIPRKKTEPVTNNTDIGDIVFYTPPSRETPEFITEVRESKISTFEEKSPDEAETPSFPVLRIIGQVFASYLLAMGDDGLYLIDQHAAQERINYECLKGWRENKKSESQGLIAPKTIELARPAAAFLLEKIDILRELGFEIEPFGENTFLVRALPLIEGRVMQPKFIHDIIDELLTSGESITGSNVRDKILMSVACKSAIKAGDSLSTVEMDNLLKVMKQTPRIFTCPHGRPTIIKISQDELARRFKRT